MRNLRIPGNVLVLLGLAGLLSLAPWSPGTAQDLVITNARIIDGTGRIIERGTIVVTEGRISSVAEEVMGAQGRREIDARGMTAMPGLIDSHRHDLLVDLGDFASLGSDRDVAAAIERETPRRLELLLAEGFTTIMVPGTYLSAAVEIRRRLDEGRLRGPRLLFTGPAFTAPGDFPVQGPVCQGNSYCADRAAVQVSDPEVARAEVRALAAAGVDAIKAMIDHSIVAEVVLDDAVLAAIAHEATSLGLPAMVHAHRVEDLVSAARLGASHLVHTPSDAAIADGAGAGILRERGIPISSTVSFTSPQFAEAAGFEYSGGARHELLLRNVRHLVDEGVVVAFGTDSPPFMRPMVEIEQLSTVLEPGEIITALTRNAAIFVGLADEIGTLEPGKAADIVLIDGDPLANVSDLACVRVVIQGGSVVVDDRQAEASRCGASVEGRAPAAAVLGAAGGERGR